MWGICKFLQAIQNQSPPMSRGGGGVGVYFDWCITLFVIGVRFNRDWSKIAIRFAFSIHLFASYRVLYCYKKHRVQRSEVRAERLVFLAKDNRHNMLRTCVTRVTYIFTAGQITVGS